MTQMTQDAKAAVPGFVAHMTTFTVDHAEGSWVWDTDGGKWLDFVVGIAVMNTGHCHPKVVQAVQEQAPQCVPHAQMNHLPAPADDRAPSGPSPRDRARRHGRPSCSC